MDGAKALIGGGHNGTAIFNTGEVGLHKANVTLIGVKVSRYCLTSFGVAPADDHSCDSTLGKQPGDRLAQPLGAFFFDGVVAGWGVVFFHHRRPEAWQS